MIIFGTRPEAIKLAPVILGMKSDPKRYDSFILATGQHDEMLSQVLNLFEIRPDKNLEIMTSGQTLFDITTRALTGMEHVLNEVSPELVLVQGDTTTAFVAALAAYYKQIPVGHVEAGLRTYNKYNPFPEEINRQLVSVLTDLHFAPTVYSSNQLQKEGIDKEKIFVTGNTVIDALLLGIKKEYTFKEKILQKINFDSKKVILLTMHRRESFGVPMEKIMSAVCSLANEYAQEVEVVFPVHFNPKVRKTVQQVLNKSPANNIHLLDPLDYQTFIKLMEKSYLIITDSGGVQEEAPSLGKPVLVLRETTERPEGIDAGTAKLVGTSPEIIYKETKNLLDDPSAYEKMAKSVSPYGDGRASERILNIIDRVKLDEMGRARDCR